MNGPELSGKRILSLDDNILDNRALSDILSGTGVDLVTTTSPEAALKMLREEHFDIFFVDHMMPGVDGVTVLGMLREQEEGLHIPVVALTGNTVSSAREAYLRAGFNGYVGKPIDRAVLFETISRCLGMYRQGEEKEKRPAILVVDDDRMNLLIAQKILSADYDTTLVTSGEAAFEHLCYNHADLILLDLRMPGMDGFKFMEIIADDEKLKGIPIICLTADDDHDSEVRCFELGAVDFITKPFIAEIMLKRIHRIIELSKLQHELRDEVARQTITLKNNTRRLERLSVQAMVTLAGTIDAKDKYTNGHSVRVAEYSRMIAQRLNMSKQEQKDIYYIGLLHDIGKIGVPDDIINKTSKLTDEEYAVIKTHPVIGAEILDKMSELPGIATGAKYHHERYDGKGYPEGLAGEEIPLVARIIGVADAYDAMASTRSYRDVLPQDVIRAEIIKCSGTQFDPIFAAVMVQIIDGDKEYNLREHK